MASPLLQKNLIIIDNGRFEDRVDQTSMRGLSWRDRRGRSEWWECKILRDIVLHGCDYVSFAWLLSLSSRFVVIVFLVFVLPRVFFLCTFSRKSLSLGGLKVLCAYYSSFPSSIHLVGQVPCEFTMIIFIFFYLCLFFCS